MSRFRAARRAGFSLIELLVVVSILGVLAAIAIPAFNGYVQRSRTVEAFQMLGTIQDRQEAYRQEFGRYCGDLAWNPSSYGNGNEKRPWDTTNAGWATLGVSPDGLLRFRYRVTVGTPGTSSGITGVGGNDFWYVAQAEGDLDSDGQTVAFETYSHWNQVFVSQGIGGPYLAAGWE